MNQKQMLLVQGLRKLKQKERLMQETLETEILQGRELTLQLEHIERELTLLEQSYNFAKARYEERLVINSKLQEKLDHLRLQKEHLSLKHKKVTDSTLVAKASTKQFRNELRHIQKQLVSPELIRSAIGELEVVAAKIIQAVKENEFEEVLYKVKTGYNHRRIGIRVRFEKLQIQSSDLKQFLRPLLIGIRQDFEGHSCKIESQVKRRLQTISVLDIKITLSLSTLEKVKLGTNRSETDLPSLPVGL